ncbi:DUF5666 domain-containing protein [Nocardia sp. GCM10030253]|uniref:DUF5666 domain-containing protein n=1 Tax=Nocardia sp. GCM10030253 TaxID=3273404 RepID=UPI00362BB316
MSAPQTPWSSPSRGWSNKRRRAPWSGPTQVGVGGGQSRRHGDPPGGDPDPTPDQTQVFGPPLLYSPVEEAARREQYSQPTVELGETPAPEHQQPEAPSRTGLLIGVGVVLLIIIGLLPMMLRDNSTSASSSSNAKPAASSSAKAPPAASPSTKVAPAASAARFVRGLAVGRVTANDGSTLTVEGVLGSRVAVRTDAGTRFLMLAATRASDVRVGTMVVVQGDKASDGSIKAKYIIGGPLGAVFGR